MVAIGVLTAGPVFADAPGEVLWAQPVNTEMDTLRVGVTGILCLRMPCPWTGVISATQHILPEAVLWSGELPDLIATQADALRIREAYDEGCVMIEGQFIENVLHVKRIIGDCNG